MLTLNAFWVIWSQEWRPQWFSWEELRVKSWRREALWISAGTLFFNLMGLIWPMRKLIRRLRTKSVIGSEQPRNLCSTWNRKIIRNWIDYHKFKGLSYAIEFIIIGNWKIIIFNNLKNININTKFKWEYIFKFLKNMKWFFSATPVRLSWSPVTL